jgi:hypothetical protein
VRSLTVKDGAAHVWDFNLHRLTRVPIRNLDEPLSSRQLQPPESSLPRLILEVEPLNSGHLLLFGQMGSDLASVVEDSMVVPFGPGVVDIPGSSEAIRTTLSRASAIVNEARGTIAAGFVHTGEMVFANASSGAIMTVTKPGSWPPPETHAGRAGGRTVLSRSRDNFLGYRSVKQSRHGVWGLFIGNTLELTHGSYASRDVHLYDWNGRLRRIMRLSVPVGDIAVNSEYLYGVDNELVPRLLRWKLPSTLLDELNGALGDSAGAVPLSS